MKRIGIAAFVLGTLTAAGWVFTAAHGQCTGIFPNNSLCGNTSGAPAPPGIVSMSNTLVLGPTTANVNDLALWANTSATVLKDGTTTSIAGIYTWLGAQTYSSSITINGPFSSTSTFTVNSNAITWPNTTGTVMFLETPQTVTGNKTFGGTQNFTGTFQISGDQIRVPAGQSGTVTLSTSPITQQVFTSAVTGTYLTPTGVQWIRVRGVGGGGGGAGAGASTAPSGSTGTSTTFGTALIVANPGLGGTGSTSAGSVTAGGTGGTVSLGATNGLAIQGGPGGFGTTVNATGGSSTGGKGGDSCYGGGSPGGVLSTTNILSATSITPSPNSGAGGGGAAGTNNAAQAQTGGGGGGAGGCFDAIIPNPTTSFAFQVGAGGAGGIGTGTGLGPGQTGATGGIWVEEHYNP